MKDNKLNQPRTFACAVVVSLALASAASANAPKVHGVELLSWSKQVEEDRYQSPRDWDKTVEHFQKMFRGWKSVRWHREVNLPSVKYIHIENTNEKAEWEGINIYEMPGGKVRIFVMKRQAPVAPPPDARPGERPRERPAQG